MRVRCHYWWIRRWKIKGILYVECSTIPSCPLLTTNHIIQDHQAWCGGTLWCVLYLPPVNSLIKINQSQNWLPKLVKIIDKDKAKSVLCSPLIALRSIPEKTVFSLVKVLSVSYFFFLFLFFFYFSVLGNVFLRVIMLLLLFYFHFLKKLVKIRQCYNYKKRLSHVTSYVSYKICWDQTLFL